MGKRFVLENGWNVDGFETKEEALEMANYHWDRLTSKEKKDVEYFKVYEVSQDLDAIKDDPLDYCINMIKDYKRA